MSKVRVYEVAKQLNLDPKAVVALFQAVGINEVRNHMSSVEPEAVERVKRHLEKQKTHDVVEERIRPTVVKRRAVAKAPSAVPSRPGSSSQVPLPPASSRADLSSMIETEQNGHSDVAGVATAAAEALGVDRPSERLSSRKLIPEDRVSSRDVSTRDVSAPASMPADRASVRSFDSVPELPAEPPPPAKVAEAVPPAPPSAVAVEAPVPPAPPSRHSVQDVAAAAAPPPVVEPARSRPRLTDDVPATPAATPAPRESTREVAAAAPAVATPPPVAAAPATPPPVEVPQVREEAAAPPPVSEAPPPPPRPAAPKTGVEYWTGRPGVPMPTPASAPRTAIGGGQTGSMPRRTEYNPRQPGGNVAGRPMRPGGPQRPPMRRPGPGGAGPRFGPGAMQRRPPAAVSTKEMSEHKKVIRIEENITLQSMAGKMSLKSTELLMKLLGMGMTGIHINTTLDADTAKILASEFGWEIEDVAQRASLRPAVRKPPRPAPKATSPAKKAP